MALRADDLAAGDVAVTGPDVVVGAGSAGAVVATVLVEAGRDVILLEAGPDHDRATTPSEVSGLNFLAACARPDRVWGDLDGRRTPTQKPRRYLRGRGVGGSSAINAMVALWGAPTDYDDWGSGWSWADTAAARTAVEARIPRWIPPPSRWSPFEAAMVSAAVSLGHERLAVGGPPAEGIGPAPLTVSEGRRVSTNDAYLETVRDRRNLSVRGGTVVEAVVIDGGRATGVVLSGGEVVRAGRVVLCAGAICSPLLLLRSGVDAPGVGANLADHPSAGFTVSLTEAGQMPSPWGPVVTTVLHFGSGLPGAAAADLQVMAMGAVGAGDAGAAETGHTDVSHAAVQVAVMGSHSRGTVGLCADGSPRVDFDLLSDERDRSRLRHGVRHLAALVTQPAVAAITVDVITEPASGRRLAELQVNDDDDALDRWLDAHTGDYVHACGTCAMGPAGRRGAVVDPLDGAVHGVAALHVIDASVFPSIPRANTHLSTVLVAEVMSHALVGSSRIL